MRGLSISLANLANASNKTNLNYVRLQSVLAGKASFDALLIPYKKAAFSNTQCGY
jgi:hypothetical protein